VALTTGALALNIGHNWLSPLPLLPPALPALYSATAPPAPFHTAAPPAFCAHIHTHSHHYSTASFTHTKATF